MFGSWAAGVAVGSKLIKAREPRQPVTDALAAHIVETFSANAHRPRLLMLFDVAHRPSGLFPALALLIATFARFGSYRAKHAGERSFHTDFWQLSAIFWPTANPFGGVRSLAIRRSFCGFEDMAALRRAALKQEESHA